jgi:hypothetical protein
MSAPTVTHETTGEYQSDQVHDYQLGCHELEEDASSAKADDAPTVDTGEYQADQVLQVLASRH